MKDLKQALKFQSNERKQSSQHHEGEGLLNVRVPPQNLEAEQSVLGGLMLEASAALDVIELLKTDDFYRPAHQKIFSAIRDLTHKAEKIDLITVSNHLEKKAELELIGGPGYLAEILSQTPTAVNVDSWARIVKDKAQLRRLIQVGNQIVEKAYEADFQDVGAFIDQMESKLLEVGDNTAAEGLTPISDILAENLKRIEELHDKKASLVGIPSGFTDLDKMTAGFQPGELIILAARPSMGKTAFSLNVAANASVRFKKRVAYFSVEMSKAQLTMRMLASESQLNLSDLRIGRVADTAWPKLIEKAAVLAEAPLLIDETSGISPYEIRSKVRRMKVDGGVDMIMIDYLQMMSLKQRVESREREVSEISRMLKAIAKEFQIPVIALAQLNRAVEGRADRRPLLSDLRESGSIEQDADVIMMLYRDDYYEKEGSESKGLAEVIIAKQRNGPTGTAKLAFFAQNGMFANLAPENLGPPPTMMNRGPARAPSDVPNFAPRGT